MSVKIEPLSNGLVTTRHPSLLLEGELQVAEDLLLKPGNTSLFKAPGRSKATGVPLNSAIDGLAYCAFDGADDRLAAVAGANYYTSLTSGSIVLSSLTSGAGSTLDAASLTNRTVLMSGGTNKVLLKDGTFRTHGLEPVTSAPGLTHSAVGGTWPLGASQLGWFEYWTTEVYKTTTEDVESTFTGTVNQVNVTAATSTVTITRPSAVNPGSTHWRVYRSLKKTLATDLTGFPVGFLIAEVPIATPSFVDGGGTAGSLTLPGTGEAFVFGGDFDAGTWSNPSNVTADDAAVATSASVSIGDDGSTFSIMRAKDFGFSVGDPITDITVQVEARRTGSAGLGFQLTWDGGISFTPVQNVTLTTGYTTLSVGGLWGRQWTAVELGNSAFAVLLRAYGTQFGVGGTVDVDFVKVSVNHGGTTAEQAVEFPRIIITAGRDAASIGANGKPPNASTGDIFQGSLVTNDVDNPTEVAWTIPGTIDYSPAIYRLSIDTKNKDSVKCIRTLSNVLLIGSESQVHRLNFLPLEDDPEFNTGRAVDLVDPDDGMVGPLAACLFTYHGPRAPEPRLFYVGRNTLRMSNGYGADTATDDISWFDMLGTSDISRCRAINNERFSEIQVLYPNTSGVFKILRLSYHPSHMKDGKLKVVSITNYSARSAASGVTDSGEKVFFTGHADGNIYRENADFIDASGGGITPRAKSREMHLAGLGMSWEIEQLGLQHPDCLTGAALVSYESTLTNYDNRTTSQQSVGLLGSRMSVITQGETGDGIAVDLAGTNDEQPWTIDYLAVFASPHGDTAPLKS